MSDVEAMLYDAGFHDVVVDVPESRERAQDSAPGPGAGDFVASALIRAKKPRAGQRRG